LFIGFLFFWQDHTGKASPAASAPTGGGNFEVSFNIPHLSTPEQQPEMDVPQVCAQDAADPESLGKITQGANIVEHPVLHPAEVISNSFFQSMVSLFLSRNFVSTCFLISLLGNWEGRPGR
jgi:hypothetical protein